ncbi:glycosyltransferase [Pelagibius litoralis]|uniref:Glycosyltransferase n=1 Tax=Pelagibius litoralis TaxID=374515 RepID=A0A967F2K7_9PROT|nr:glycosyltransferase family 4 protein [Pelagibius litoralis]NIA72026.1 glycosyltransferase [Pelagibius litoralis]
MKYLFVHQNMPGQYKHICQRLAADKDNTVVFITKREGIELPNIHKVIYKPNREPAESTHRYIREAERGILHGQEVARKALELKSKGFVPDIIIGHPGWGETLYLKDVFPDTPLLNFFEFYYHAVGADVGFDPDVPTTLDTHCRIRTKNIVQFMGLEAADAGMAPTLWQYGQYPEEYRHKISVIHDGIDTAVCKANPDASLEIKNTDGAVTTLRQGEEVITFVVRNLEPYRGFPQFMRAAEQILKRRPQAKIIIVGGDEVSYGRALPNGETYRNKLLQEVDLDLSRVFFLGRVPYSTYLQVIQVSAVHVYLTFPFVLSWSMLESMSSECLVLASATPPVTEVIKDGVNGLLFDFYDHEAIANRVDEVLGHKDRMAAIRKKARATVLQNYDLEKCLKEQLKLIENLVAGKRPVAGSKPGKPSYRAAARPSGSTAASAKTKVAAKSKAKPKAKPKSRNSRATPRKSKTSTGKPARG